MKEQWKKLDSDGKLLVDVEEGKQLPIKINIPLSALTPPRDEFCCNRLLTVLRVFVLLALLTLLGWTATTVYSNYYDKSIAAEQDSLENKFAFQNLVYKNKDDFGVAEEFKKSNPESEEFRDSTKRALDQIAIQIRGFNERLDQLQVEKEQQQMESDKVKEDAKSIDTSELSDQTLDYMMEDLAKQAGLAENKQLDNVQTEHKPELDAIIVTEPLTDDFSDLQKQLQQDRINLISLLDKLNIETKLPENIDESHEDHGFESQFINGFMQQSVPLDNSFLTGKSNEESEFEAIFGNNDPIENDNAFDEAQKEFLGFLDKMASEALIPNVDESHEDDKDVDQVVQAVVNRMATSNLENDSDSEQQSVEEGKVEEEPAKNQDDETDLVGALLSFVMNEAATDDSLSGRFDFENIEESHVEDKVEKQLMDQLDEDKMLTEIGGEHGWGDMVASEMMEAEEGETKTETEDKFYEDGPSLLDEIIDLIVNDDENKEDSIIEVKSTEYNAQSASDTPFQVMSELGFFDQTEPPSGVPVESTVFSENKEINDNGEASIQESLSEKKPLVDMVPSVEYVKKIEENPFIPRVAKMLEPIVGQSHELLIWYYTHKNLPDFLKGADKWKVFGSKLLYDSNIKDYPADATIVSGLAFEKVYAGAEYPSGSEDIQSDLQQEIINRLILKSYLNKMLLEGNAEAETLSQVIEQHNQEKLKELDIDPQQLTYIGDFFEVDSKDNGDLIIPVVQFDPFVDESREANEQRAQVIKAFGMTRNFDGVIIKPTDEKYSQHFFGSISDADPEPVKMPEQSTHAIGNIEVVNAENSSPSFGLVTNENPTETPDAIDWLTEFLPKEQSTDSTMSKAIVEEINAENSSPATEFEEYQEEDVNMNDYLYSYLDSMI